MLGLTAFAGGRPALTIADAPADPQGEQFARVFDSSGNLTFDNSSAGAAAPIDRNAVSQALQGHATHQTESRSGDDVRVLTTSIRRDSTVVGALQVGLSEGDLHNTLHILLLIIAVAYPLTLVVTSAGGVFLAGRALAPIEGLTRAPGTSAPKI